MGWFRSNDEDKAQAIQDNVNALRVRARGANGVAKVAKAVGAHGIADRSRHNAKLDRMLADQQEAGLKSGAYRAGTRQHPTVEEQCGCIRYCGGRNH